METPSRTPAWMFALCGALFALAFLEQFPDSPSEAELRARTPAGFANAEKPRLESASPRELRALPGIGETRALAIARERFESGPITRPEELERIRGIGPQTVERVRAVLEVPGR